MLDAVVRVLCPYRYQLLENVARDPVAVIAGNFVLNSKCTDTVCSVSMYIQLYNYFHKINNLVYVVVNYT